MFFWVVKKPTKETEGDPPAQKLTDLRNAVASPHQTSTPHASP